MNTLWRKQDGKLRASVGLRWAQYDYTSGIRVATGEGHSCQPTDDELAAWDMTAPLMVVDLSVAARNVAADTIVARYAGRCALTDRAYGPGTRIQRTIGGWALASVATPGNDQAYARMSRNPETLGRLMDREDSSL